MILCLAGGVGGAKLAQGFSELCGERLTVAVNTGDDFEHLGLYIAPDLDTVTYTLAGINNLETGWGRAGETWNFIDSVATLGGESWFRLGDRDLATHVLRTMRLAAGETLSAVTHDFAHRLGIAPRIVPMSDQPVRTIVLTDDGPLAFQEYFVRRQCRPKVAAFRFEGASRAVPAPAFAGALSDARLKAIVICPSNPYLSIAPILSVGDLKQRLANRTAPLIAVSPIVQRAALKGPAAKIMRELGSESSATAVAKFYQPILDGFVMDHRDADEAAAVRDLGIRVLLTDTIMKSPSDQRRLAEEVAEFALKTRH